MRACANAWVTGDLDTLRRLPLSDQLPVCLAALSQSGMAQELGLTGIDTHVEAAWAAAASKALAANRVTFAQLPMARLLGRPGYLAALQAQGAAVAPPDGLIEEATGPASGSSAAPAGATDTALH